MDKTAGYQVFEVDDSIVSFAKDLIHDIVIDGMFKVEQIPDFRLPSENTVLCVGSVIFMIELHGGSIHFNLVDGKPMHFCSLLQDGYLGFPAWVTENLISDAATEALFISTILSILSQPNVTVKERADHCRKRREFNKSHPHAYSESWTQVTWDLSKATKARLAADPTFRKVPFHHRRGHPRRAEAHYKGAYQIPEAIREEDRQGWWQWIEAKWVGNPCFGIRRSIYAPKLSTGDLARYPAEPWANHGRDQHVQRPALPELPAQQGWPTPRGGSAHCLGKAPLERTDYDQPTHPRDARERDRAGREDLVARRHRL